MTEEQISHSGRPHGGVELPLPGIKTARDYEEAEEHLVDTDVDPEENELHVTGQRCVRCGRAIRPEDDVRRTASGGYEHEFCEVRADPQP